MKKLLVMLSVLLMANNLYAQKRGYKEIQIGVNFNIITALHKYKITSDTVNKTKRLIVADSLTIFSEYIDYLEVSIDDKNIIKQVLLYTKPKFFKNYTEWRYNLNNVLSIASAEVHKTNSSNISRDSQDDAHFAWSFTDTKTALSLWVQKIYETDANFKRNYIFEWMEDEKNQTDKKILKFDPSSSFIKTGFVRNIFIDLKVIASK